jgi:dihydroorotase
LDKLLLRGARLLDPSSHMDETGDLLICGDKIEHVGGTLHETDARVINAAGMVAAPGLIDMHVHLRDPGFTEKEDVLSGCRAAGSRRCYKSALYAEYTSCFGLCGGGQCRITKGKTG